MKAILLSIKTEYVENIAGTKRYEYRKRLAKAESREPRGESTTILLYSTSPAMKIVAKAEILGTICVAPSALWEKAKGSGGISRQNYREYFHGRKTAYAYELGKIQIFDSPKNLSDFNISLAP